MSRAAVYQALCTDAELIQMGIDEDHVFPNYSMDGSPSRQPFLILRWEEQRLSGSVRRGPQRVTVWAHSPVEHSTDFNDLNRVLDRVKDVLEAMEQVEGEDGYVVTSVRFTGSGGDLKDTGYNTITKNSAFEVLCRAA